MANKKISKKAQWDKRIEDINALCAADLNDPLETYFYKTPSRITFTKQLPVNIKMKLISAFLNIYN